MNKRNKSASKNAKSTRNEKFSNGRKRDDFSNSRNGRVASPTNDPNWYAQSPQLLYDSASLSYSWPLGNKLELESSDYSATKRGSGYDGSAIPGIMSFEITPGIGYSDNNVSPINIAANNFYSYIRHANSGHANYDAPDLMMYLVAMDSAYYMLSYLQRTYGILMSYSQENRYFGRALIYASGFDYDDLIANLANFRAFINVFAVRVGSMYVPNGMSYYLRHSQLFSGIYMEEPTAKTQIYLCNPSGYFTYDEMSSQSGGLLKFHYINTTLSEGSVKYLKFNEIVAICNSILDPIIASEDLNIMSGDILKAYGDGNILKVSEIDESFKVMPTVDVMFLNQLKNSHIMTPRFTRNLDIVQDPDTNIIKYTPYRDIPTFGKGIITTDQAVVSPAMTMEWTRLQTMSDQSPDADGRYPLTHLGSEFVSRVFVWKWGFRFSLTYDPGHEWTVVPTEIGSQQSMGMNIPDSFSETNMRNQFESDARSNVIQLEKISAISKFKYHPRFECSLYINPGTAATQANLKGTWHPGMFFDIDNYAIVDIHALDKMNLAALLSEFDCPQMGKLTKV